MYPFIKKTLIFLLQAFGGIVLLFIFFNHLSKKLLEGYRFTPGIHKIAMGDSRMQLALNDKLLRGTKNLSKDSESFFYTYFKLKGLLDANNQVDTVFLGVSYHSFSSYYDHYVYLPNIASRYFFLLSLNAQTQLLKNSEQPLQILMQAILTAFRNSFSNQEAYSFIGSYASHDLVVSAKSESIKKRIRSQYYDEGELQNLSQWNLRYFDRIKEMCKEKNVQLILLNTPMYSEYSEQVPAKFKETYEMVVKKPGVNSIEFEDLILLNEDFFLDGDHLSESGGNKTTEYIMRVLKNTNASETDKQEDP